jgi:hypothetical protein
MTKTLIESPHQLKNDIRECLAALQNINDSLIACGKVIATACERNPFFLSRLHEAAGGTISLAFLGRIERVGRGVIDPRLVQGLRNGILAERLPLPEQTRIIDKGVEVATGERGEKVEILRLEEMDQATAVRVLVNGTIADIKTQRASIASQDDMRNRIQRADGADENIRKVLQKLHIEIDKKKSQVTFTQKVTLKATQLRMLLAELER